MCECDERYICVPCREEMEALCQPSIDDLDAEQEAYENGSAYEQGRWDGFEVAEFDG